MIAVTSARDADVVRHAVAQGVVLYLLKPFTFAAFRAKLEQYAAYRAELRPGAGEVVQDEVDRLLGVAARREQRPLPKGMSAGDPARRDRRRCARPTAATVGDRGGRGGRRLPGHRPALPRAPRRHRAVERQPRYGGSGRPEVEYRWK